MNEHQSDQVERLMGGALYAVVKSLTEIGLRPAAALRLASFVLIDGSMGRGALRSLGLPERTERAWRAELREVAELADELPDEFPVEFMNELLPLMGLEQLEVRRRPGKQPADHKTKKGGADDG